MSPSWKRALGYEPDDLPNTVEAWKSLLVPGEYERAELAVGKAFEGEAPYDIVLGYRRADGTIAHMRARAVVQRNATGQPVRMIGTHTDVTEQVAAESARERVLEELEVRNKDLEAFARVISHDLKAPMRGIQNLVPWILDSLDDTVDPGLMENLGFLRNRARWMEHLVGGVLTYSRATHGQIKWELHDASALVKEVVLQVGAADIVQAKDLPSLVLDGLRFQQVAQNLIGNAIDHGGARNIVFTATREPGFWNFRVEDDGRGFPVQSIDPFKMFSGGPDSASGVGLAICRSLIEKMGGTIAIESTVGVGTCVRFGVPDVEL